MYSNAIVGVSPGYCIDTCVLSVWPRGSFLSPLWLCCMTFTWDFVHHTLDLLYWGLAFHPSEKASQCVLGWEYCLDPDLSTHPLNPFIHSFYIWKAECLWSFLWLLCVIIPPAAPLHLEYTLLGFLGIHFGWKPLQGVWFRPSGMLHHIPSLHDLISMRWYLSLSGGGGWSWSGDTDLCKSSFCEQFLIFHLTFPSKKGIARSFSSSLWIRLILSWRWDVPGTCQVWVHHVAKQQTTKVTSTY